MNTQEATKIVYGNDSTCAKDFCAARAYLTAERIASHVAYLKNVREGMDTVAAWKLHKARIAAT